MSEPSHEISISIQDLIRFLLRGLVIAAVLAGVTGAVVYVITQREPPVFRADATILVARTSAGFGQFGLSPVMAPPIDLSAYRAAAGSDRVLADALARLGVAEATGSDIRSLRGRTSAYVAGDGRDSSLLGIEARGQTAAEAIARADALAEALVDWDRRRATESLTRVINTLEQQIAALGEQVRVLQASTDTAAQTQMDGLVRLRAEQQQQLSYARALVASAEGLLSVMQPAATTPRQIAPRPLLSATIAALLAIVATYALLLLRSALNTRLGNAEDIASATGLSLLAEFPKHAAGGDDWRQQEAANYLRTNILFATADAHPKIILVTSPNEHEGKTSVVCHLAEGFARNGYRTLLVDADLRAPSIGERYGIDEQDDRVSTTADWMFDSSSRGRSVMRVTLDADAEFFVVPQFWTNSDPSRALARGFPRALAQWEGYDVIVVDSAPLLAVADTLAIAPYCTGTVLVVDAQKTDRTMLTTAREMLERVEATIFGVVANRVRSASRGASGGAYGSAYGSRPRKAKTSNVARARKQLAGSTRRPG